MLKGRVRRCVCKYCGNDLKVKRIIFSDFEDARIEIYCEYCQRLEYGVESEIYASAKRFVEQLEFNFYSDMDDNTKRKRMNIAKVCEIMAWGYQDLALSDEKGFTVNLPKKKQNWEECIVLAESEMAKEGR